MPRYEPPATFQAFQAMLAELLDVDPARLSRDAYFVTDLGVDSFRMLSLLFRLEELGIELAFESAWEIQTVGDAYRVYQERVKGNG